MKRCNHTNWLSLDAHHNEITLLEFDRLQTVTNQITDADSQQPSLVVLIGNKSKLIALHELFGVRRIRKLGSKRSAGEIHLHVDPATIFHGVPILLADGDLACGLGVKAAAAAKCHDTTKRAVLRQSAAAADPQTVHEIADGVYSRLLYPFADVFCFFSADLGGFRQIARHLATWLKNGPASTLPNSTHPRVVIVTEKIPPTAERQQEARKAFLWMLSEETTQNLFEKISALEVVSLLPKGKVSAEARYRRLKEHLLNGSDEVRKNREDTRTLFSATHLAALFRYACGHFCVASQEPFHFIKASRKQNPVAPDLDEHLSNFLKYVNSPKELMEFAAPIIASSILLDNYPPDSHKFESNDVFQALYRHVFLQVSRARIMAFGESPDVILRSGFINTVECHLRTFFERSIQGTGEPSSEIHRDNLKHFEDRWPSIQSSSICLVCLRRRPQHSLPCGHIICENCIMVFSECRADDPWAFAIHRCFLCGKQAPDEMTVKIHPPTAGVGILCIDGGGTRGVVPLVLLKRIQDCIDLPIPPQKFFKIAVGVSSGSLVVAATFINGWSIKDTTETFEKFAKAAFKRRTILNIPFLRRIILNVPFLRRITLNIPLLSRILELMVSYFADGLYPAENIEKALKEVFGSNRSILDYSYATSIGARIGLLVATIRDPSSCLFTNYNAVGARDRHQGYHVIQPKDGYGRVPIWEIARCASAAPLFFPPKTIDGVGTFQDAGPLENDPLISALSEAAALFPLIDEPDFVVSLGTGESRSRDDGPCMSGSRGVWKDGAFPRLCRMFWERMRDQRVRQTFRDDSRYHRLDTAFDGRLPRLDDTASMSDIKLKVQDDDTVSAAIEVIARCATASLFYFELESIPEGFNGKYIGVGSILCDLRRDDPALKKLLRRLSSMGATFYLDDSPVVGIVGDRSFFDKDGNFRKRVELSTSSKFTISLKQGDSSPSDISGSPYSIDKMISAQGLNAYFGRANHQKRKGSIEGLLSSKKRQRF